MEAWLAIVDALAGQLVERDSSLCVPNFLFEVQSHSEMMGLLMGKSASAIQPTEIYRHLAEGVSASAEHHGVSRCVRGSVFPKALQCSSVSQRFTLFHPIAQSMMGPLMDRSDVRHAEARERAFTPRRVAAN